MNTLVFADSILQKINNLISFIDATNDVKSNIFKVISFNVLADCYAQSNSEYPTYCLNEYLTQTYRFQQIGNTLRKCDADIIALQEIDALHTTLKLLNINENTYEIRYHQKPNKKPDGLLIAYNKHKFHCYNNTQLQYINLNDLCKGSESQNFHKMYYHKNCIAVYQYLCHIHHPKHIIIVINTHLFYRRNAELIRLRQCAYILNTIHYKVQRLYQNENVDKISIIFCGDFNSLSNGAICYYLSNGSYTIEAKGNEELKLIMDAQLHKIGRWCRSIGIDIVCSKEYKLDKTNADLIFNRAKSEDRILVTRSKKLVQRKECPPYLLLSGNDFKKNLTQIIKYFDLKYDENAAYSRCTLCNGMLKQIESKTEIINHSFIPSALKMDTFVSFWECIQCAQVIWFGLDEDGKKDKLTDNVMKILEIMDELKEEKEKENMNDHKNDDEKEVILKLLPNLQTFIWRNIVIVNPFKNALKSSFKQIHQNSPIYTNKTSEFEGCLDYIFYGNGYDRRGCIRDIKCIHSEIVEGDKHYYPNKSWSSDHVLLSAIFTF